jgi:AcrR family transcriptional regulator
MAAKVKTKRRSKARALVRGEPVVHGVLAAALSEVARAGYHGLRIEDVAARAGVNKTTVYRRWPSKQELLRDALLSITTETFSTPDTGSLRGDLLAIARRNAALVAKSEHQGVFRIFIAEGEDAELAAIVRSLRQAFEGLPREVLAAAEARGEIRPGTDARLLFDVLSATLHWWLLFDRVPVDEAAVQRLVDLLLDGALAPGRRDRPTTTE